MQRVITHIWEGAVRTGQSLLLGEGLEELVVVNDEEIPSARISESLLLHELVRGLGNYAVAPNSVISSRSI
jgi:hypothetical protein